VWKAIDPTTSMISQMHFTILDESGQKAPVEQQKKYSKAISKLEPEAYRVAPVAMGDPNTCIIAEGIETALSARRIFEILAPDEVAPTAYASMDAGMMKKFKPFIGDLAQQTWWICGDRDVSNTGQQAAATCKMNIASLRGDYNQTHVVLPDEDGLDWNDILTLGDNERMMNIIRPV